MGKFVIRTTSTGYKFELKASNGETIATSEVYSTHSACKKGVQSVVRCAPHANLSDLTEAHETSNPRFEIYLDRAGEYRFRLRSRNGKIIAVSEGYKNKMSCENGIESVRRNVERAEIMP